MIDAPSENPKKKLFWLASLLVENDNDKSCPFCKKIEWGTDKHEKDCPFALAYAALKEGLE